VRFRRRSGCGKLNEIAHWYAVLQAVTRLGRAAFTAVCINKSLFLQRFLMKSTASLAES